MRHMPVDSTKGKHINKKKKIRHGCWNAGYYGKETERLGVDEECCGISKPSTLKRSWVLMGREERYLGLVTENPSGLLH